MRFATVAVLLLMVLWVASVSADTETTKTANVDLSIGMFVALSQPIDDSFTIVQDDAPKLGLSFGGNQHIWLRKNCDVNVLLDVTDMIPDPGTLAKGAYPLAVDAVSLGGRDGTQFPNGGHAEQVFHWLYCTENGDGEDVHIDYHWKRLGLCDHAGTYTATITVTAIGIDP